MGDTPYNPYNPNVQGNQSEREGTVYDPATGSYLPAPDPAQQYAGASNAPVYSSYPGGYGSPVQQTPDYGTGREDRSVPHIEPPKHYEVPNYDALLNSRPRPSRRRPTESPAAPASYSVTPAPNPAAVPEAPAPSVSRVRRRTAAERTAAERQLTPPATPVVTASRPVVTADKPAQPVPVPVITPVAPREAAPVPTVEPVKIPHRPAAPVVVEFKRDEEPVKPVKTASSEPPKVIAPPVVVEVKKIRKGDTVQPVVVPVAEPVRPVEPRSIEILTPPAAVQPAPVQPAPVEEPVVEPVMPDVAAPAEEPVAESVAPVVAAPAEESVVEPVKPVVTAPAEESVVEPVMPVVAAPAEESVVEPVKPVVAAPAEESVVEPVKPVVTAPAEESVVEPVAPVVAPAVEIVPVKTVDVFAEPAVVPTQMQAAAPEAAPQPETPPSASSEQAETNAGAEVAEATAEQDLSSLVEEFLAMNLKKKDETVLEAAVSDSGNVYEPVASEPVVTEPAVSEPAMTAAPAETVLETAVEPVVPLETITAPVMESVTVSPVVPAPAAEQESPILVKRHDEERAPSAPLFGIGFDAPLETPIEPIQIDPVIPAPLPVQTAAPEAPAQPTAAPELNLRASGEPAQTAQAEVVTFTEAPQSDNSSEQAPSFSFDDAKNSNGFETITFGAQPEEDVRIYPPEKEPVTALEENTAIEEQPVFGDFSAPVATDLPNEPSAQETPAFADFSVEPEPISFADFGAFGAPDAGVETPAAPVDAQPAVSETAESAPQEMVDFGSFDVDPAPVSFTAFEDAVDTPAGQEPTHSESPEPMFGGFAVEPEPVSFAGFDEAFDAPDAPTAQTPAETAPTAPDQPVFGVFSDFAAEEPASGDAPAFGIFSDEAPALEPMPEPAFGAFGTFGGGSDAADGQSEITTDFGGFAAFGEPEAAPQAQPETDFGGFGAFGEPEAAPQAQPETEFSGFAAFGEPEAAPQAQTETEFGGFGAFGEPEAAPQPQAETDFGGFGAFGEPEAAPQPQAESEFGAFGGTEDFAAQPAEPGLSGNLFDTAFIPPAGGGEQSDIYDIADHLGQAMLAQTYNQAFTDNNLLPDSGHAGLTVTGLSSEYFVSERGAKPDAMFENVGFTLNDGCCLAIAADIPLSSYTLARAIAESYDDGEEQLVTISDSQDGEEREILYVGSDEMIPDEMTCTEFLLYSLSAVYGEEPEEREERVRVALSQVGMGEIEDDPLADLSHNKRLLVLALSAALNPNIGCVIFNDNGFNIEGVEENMARRVFALLASNGKSAILSCCSSYLMATVANRVLALKGGRIVFDGSFRTFIDSNCLGILSFTSRNPQQATQYLQSQFPNISVLGKGNLIYLIRKDGSELDIERLIQAVAACGADYNSVVMDDKSFDIACKEVLGE